tara:strand:+ start:6710 stop:7156 length:447 start_codon:yes stop_codon:yes gene_type:complete
MSNIIKTITNQSSLQELIDLGLLKEADIKKFNGKLQRAADSQARKALLEGTKSAIKALVESDVHSGNKYWSVKPAAHSLGFMTYIEADRGIILKALTKLTEEGFLSKIGLKTVDGKLTELSAKEVNAFQIRYIVTPQEAEGAIVLAAK